MERGTPGPCTTGHFTLNRRLRTQRSICGFPIKTSRRRVRQRDESPLPIAVGGPTDGGRTGGQQMAPEIDDGESVPRAPLVNWSIGAPPPLARLTTAAVYVLLLILYSFRRNVYRWRFTRAHSPSPHAHPDPPARPTDRRYARTTII